MNPIGRVESLWRYPVKSMRGEQLPEAFVGFSGIYGDRMFAIRSSAAPAGFPYLTGREKKQLLLYRPIFRCPDLMARPSNLAEAEVIPPGATPLYPGPADHMVDVETPDGERLPIDDPLLLDSLRRDLRGLPNLTLLRSHRAMTDCRPVSLFSIQTVRQLSGEVGTALDKRRFRANIYLDLDNVPGFAEDAYVGRTVRIGARTTLAVLLRDPRCKMITLDPDTAQPDPEVIRCLARSHDTKAGLYAAVLEEGTIRPKDEITLLD